MTDRDRETETQRQRDREFWFGCLFLSVSRDKTKPAFKKKIKAMRKSLSTRFSRAADAYVHTSKLILATLLDTKCAWPERRADAR